MKLIKSNHRIVIAAESRQTTVQQYLDFLQIYPSARIANRQKYLAPKLFIKTVLTKDGKGGMWLLHQTGW